MVHVGGGRGAKNVQKAEDMVYGWPQNNATTVQLIHD